MKKFLSLFAIAAMSLTLFTACDDDEDTPDLKPVDVSDGVIFVCSGNQSSSIDGSITYLNTANRNATLSAFKAANGRSLGLTANDALVYGSKMYIVVTKENTVEVCDRNTLKSIKQIKTTELLGTDKGLQPRHLTAYNGKVYLSTYGTDVKYGGDGTAKGYVAAIDTASYTATTYPVGAFPECMTVCNGKLYVANSSYGYGAAPSISEIDLSLSSGNVKDITSALVQNPIGIATGSDGAVYIQDSGSYDASYNQVGAAIVKYANGTFTKACDATAMSMSGDGNKIYVINAPYSYTSVVTPAYNVYDVSTGSTTKFIDGNDVESPTAIGVDPVNGRVYILSYSLGESGYADHKANGYAVEYDSTGSKIGKYTVGTGPTAVAFNTGVKYE